jgi:signal transduction histidine kinase
MMRTALDVATGKPGPQLTEVTVLSAKVRKGLDRAERLIEGLLLLARARHAAAADGTVISLGQAAKAALAERSAAIEILGLTVEQALADAPVLGSEILLARMTDNVIDNAVSHNRPGGWIRVTTVTEGRLARLSVETGGRVLGQREVSRLGQPFRRLGAERTGSDTGTGLGQARHVRLPGRRPGPRPARDPRRRALPDDHRGRPARHGPHADRRRRRRGTGRRPRPRRR